MTNDRPDPRPTDPMRALDDVDAPDAWDDIADRATRPATAGSSAAEVLVGAPAARTRLLAAAAVLVVAAVAAGLVLANQGSDPSDLATTPGGEAGGMTIKTEWILTRLTNNSGEIAIPDPDTDRPAVLDLSKDGRVSFTACNQGGAAGRVDGDRLRVEDEWGATEMACTGTDGESRMALDAQMGEFLTSDPTIEMVGTNLTLTSMATVAEFRALEVPASQELQTVRDGDAPCEVGLPVADPTHPGGVGAPVGTTPLAAGLAEPALVDWSLGGDDDDAAGAWHLRLDEQIVEIHVPGTMVIDLVGEDTSTVQMADGNEATMWVTGEWVQLRVFETSSQPADSPCSTYDVTVAGPDQADNEDLATSVAKYLVIVPVLPDGTAEPVTTTAPPEDPDTPVSNGPVTTTAVGSAGPAAIVTTTSIAGSTSCSIEFAPGEDATYPWTEDPPDLSPAFLRSPGDSGTTQDGAVEATFGGTLTQVETPATPLDTAGLTKETHTLPDGRELEVWVGDSFAQTQVIPAERDACGGFTVTIGLAADTGPTYRELDLLLTVADKARVTLR